MDWEGATDMPMVPMSWLRDYVDADPAMTTEELAAALVRVGLEEETIHPARVSGPLVVGRVLTRDEFEASNGKLVNYCRVDVGEHNDAPGTGKEPSDLPSRGIICGAHNFEVGDYVVVSLPGAVLPGPFEIAARKTYGHVSDGMMCSARELGLGDDHNGIIILQKDFPDAELPAVGHSVISFLGLGEEVLEINVTPDRGYCFSMRGVAREFSHSTGAAFRDPGLVGTLVTSVPEANEAGFPVVVADNAPIHGRVGADRFVTRIVRGVNPKAPTPRWVVERLEMAGMRSLSLAVDITNYIMLDLGQPMHAYDLSALAAPIVVRRARAGEELTTLDEVTRTLDPEDLVISDSPNGEEGSRLLGIAGVMGGAYSEVEDSTTDILLEAAHFDAVSVARSSRRHKLHSEAAKRFERGTDPLLPAVAAQRAVDLLVQYGGGQADPAVFDLNTLPAPTSYEFALSDAERLTGVSYAPERVCDLLEQVGCVLEDIDGQRVRVIPPSWRPDLTGSAHFVEEIARLDGYDRIPSVLPTAPAGTGLTTAQRARRLVAQGLAHAGLTEVESYPFVSDSFDKQGLSANDPRRRAVKLRNPLADDAPLLRTSVLDTLLDTAARNWARGIPSVAIFEIAKVVHPEGVVPTGLISAEHRPSDEQLAALEAGTPSQPWHVGAVLAGNARPAGILDSQRNFDWADAVEIARSICDQLGVRVEVTRAWLAQPSTLKGPRLPGAATDPAEVAPWHPGRVARIFARQGKDCVELALAGELSPKACKAFGLPARACALELDVDALISVMSDEPMQVKPVSTYPAAKEDLALVVPTNVPVSRVEQVIRQAAGALIEDLVLFDIYEGDQVPEGFRSLAFSVRLRAGDHTLTPDEVQKVRADIVSKTGKVLGATLRG